MSQIKFRGKRVDGGSWVYGDLCNYLFDGKKKTVPCIHIGNLGYIKNAFYQVDPETIGQFIGLLDKNGKEIFEGDIMEEQDIRYEVCWYEAIAAFMAEEIEEEKPFLMSDFDLSVTTVIGNIHDNPKMLKGGK